jgi:hypothetical protein
VEVENETEPAGGGEIRDRHERRLEVGCDEGTLEIEYERENETEEEFSSGGAGWARQRNESSWTYDGTDLQDFERENRTGIGVNNDTNQGTRQNFLDEQGLSAVTDLQRFEHREEVRYEREDAGVEFEYEMEDETRTFTDGTETESIENETDAEHSDATMPSFGGPGDVIATYLDDEFTEDCLTNGWCVSMADDSDPAGPTATADDTDSMASSDHVQIRIIEVTAEESQ